MAFPLIPVLIGAGAVAAVTYYLVNNKRSQNRISEAAQDLGDSVQAGAEKLERVASDAVDDARAAVEDAASSVKDAASKVID